MSDRFIRNVTGSFLGQLGCAGQAGAAGWSAEVPEVDADMVEAFLKVGAQTSIPTQELQDIAVQWATIERGKKGNNTTRIAKALCHLDWSWIAFDEMVQILLRDDLWPLPWHHYEKRIKAGEPLDDVRAKIFIQTARTAAASMRLRRSRRFQIMVSLEGWHLYTDSEVGAHYVRLFGAGVDPKDSDTWPPLYPGDVSVIKSGLEGVHSRFGRFFGLGNDRPFWAAPYKR